MINLVNAINCIITHSVDSFVFSKILKEKTKIDIKTVFTIFFVSLLDFTIAISSNQIIKTLFSNFITFILFKALFHKSNSKTIMATILTYLGYAVGEVIVVIILYGIMSIDTLIMNSFAELIICNIFIYIIYFVLFNINRIQTMVRSIIDWYDYNKKINTIINILILFISFTIMFYFLSFNRIENVYEFVLSLIVTLTLIVLGAGLYKNKSDNIKLSKEYDEQIKYSKIYQDELFNKGKILHEHNNELLMYKEMIKHKNYNEALKCIDSKLDKYNSFVEKDWLFKIKKLPESYISSFLALKIAEMNNHGITVALEVDDKLNNNKTWKVAYDNINDLTNIFGILLDNVIDACNNSNIKDAIIEIKNLSGIIQFKISNSYSKEIDLNKISTRGYSTKGVNHGYGLSVLEDILNNNKNLTSSVEINGMFYTRIINIKK